MADITVLPSAEWRNSYELEKLTKFAKSMPGQKASRVYDPTTKELPDMPLYRLGKIAIDHEMKAIGDTVITMLEPARREDQELMTLRKSTEQISKVQFNEQVAVGIVGQQAMGKSLLINALLHRREPSKTSAAGSVCTASATRYRRESDMDDFGNVYDAYI